MSVGYATLYGDMAGGFAVIKDVPKTLVYRLVRYRNGLARAARPPPNPCSSEPLRRASPRPARRRLMPPYEMLDRILAAYVEGDSGRDEIATSGIPRTSSTR